MAVKFPPFLLLPFSTPDPKLRALHRSLSLGYRLVSNQYLFERASEDLPGVVLLDDSGLRLFPAIRSFLTFFIFLRVFLPPSRGEKKFLCSGSSSGIDGDGHITGNDAIKFFAISMFFQLSFYPVR